VCAGIQNSICFKRCGSTNVASRHKLPKLHLMARFLEKKNDVKIECCLVKYLSN